MNGSETTSPAVAPRKIGRPLKTGWEEKFFAAYRECESQRTAAKAAGVSHTIIAKRAKANPEFDERLTETREGFLDDLESDLVIMARTKNNVIAALARLKADRPSRYVEKLQVAGAVAHVHAGPSPEEIDAILRELLVHARPETRASLGLPPVGNTVIERDEQCLKGIAQ